MAVFKRINNIVKEKSNDEIRDGKALMFFTFDRESPVLKLNSLGTESERNEQEGFMHIFAGSIQGIRNLRGHEDTSPDSPIDALEHLCLASLLARKLDNLKK